jgi:hypothetical protein
MNQPIANRQRQRQRQGIDRDRAENAPARGIDRGQVATVRAASTPDGLEPLTERRAPEFEWASKYLPAEHTGFVVSALIGLQLAGLKRSTQSVMARLEGQGRTMAQMKAKGWV